MSPHRSVSDPDTLPGHDPDRWEHGSELHWLTFGVSEEPTACPWDGAHLLYGTGRDAIYALLVHGGEARGWKRIWIPGYFCQDVAATMAATGLELAAYPDDPLHRGGVREDVLKPGDVVLEVNFFGLWSSGCQGALPKGAERIEDHSHDPWSAWAAESSADFCFASLRKTLPLPDGGVLWSPRRHPLPAAPKPSERHRAAADDKLKAMILKLLYLDGHRVDKTAFRRLAERGERQMGAHPVAAVSTVTAQLLPLLPVDAWRAARKTNHRLLVTGFENRTGVTVLEQEDDGCCPFAGMLLFDTPAGREHARRRLIEKRIYPAVLWPLEKPVVSTIPERARELSRRILAVHCDMRYDESDMKNVVRLLREATDLLS